MTSAANAYWKADGMVTEVTTGTADVTVNDASAAQTWEGFGGAFNEVGWKYLMMLSEADRSTALKLLFGDDGARFTWVASRLAPVTTPSLATRSTRPRETPR